MINSLRTLQLLQFLYYDRKSKLLRSFKEGHYEFSIPSLRAGHLVSLRLRLMSRCQEQLLCSKLVRHCEEVMNYNFQGPSGPKQLYSRTLQPRAFRTLKMVVPSEAVPNHYLKLESFHETRKNSNLQMVLDNHIYKQNLTG